MNCACFTLSSECGGMRRIYAGLNNRKTACGLRRLTVNLTAAMLVKHRMIFGLFIVSWPSDCSKNCAFTYLPIGVLNLKICRDVPEEKIFA